MPIIRDLKIQQGHVIVQQGQKIHLIHPVSRQGGRQRLLGLRQHRGAKQLGVFPVLGGLDHQALNVVVNPLAFSGLARLGLAQVCPRLGDLLSLLAAGKDGHLNAHAERDKIAPRIIGREPALPVAQIQRDIRPVIALCHLDICPPHRNPSRHGVQGWPRLIRDFVQGIGGQGRGRKADGVWRRAYRTLQGSV